MIVGEAGVGKTTLMKRLSGSSSSEMEKHPPVATDGVDLGELILNGFRFVCWDFAGKKDSFERLRNLLCSSTWFPF